MPIHFGKKIIGSEGGESRPEKDITKITKIIRSNKINIKQLVSKIYKLDNINKAIQDIRSGNKVIIPPKLFKSNELNEGQIIECVIESYSNKEGKLMKRVKEIKK